MKSRRVKEHRASIPSGYVSGSGARLSPGRYGGRSGYSFSGQRSPRQMSSRRRQGFSGVGSSSSHRLGRRQRRRRRRSPSIDDIPSPSAPGLTQGAGSETSTTGSPDPHLTSGGSLEPAFTPQFLKRRIDNLSMCLASNPDTLSAAHALFVRGLTFSQLLKFGDAVQDLTAVLQSMPSWREAWLFRGECHYHLHAYLDAIRDLTWCIGLFERDAASVLLSSRRRRKEGECEPDTDDSDDLGGFSRRLRLRQDLFESALYYRALSYHEVGALSHAMEDLTRAINLGGSNASLYYLRGMIRDRFSHLAMGSSHNVVFGFAPAGLGITLGPNPNRSRTKSRTVTTTTTTTEAEAESAIVSTSTASSSSSSEGDLALAPILHQRIRVAVSRAARTCVEEELEKTQQGSPPPISKNGLVDVDSYVAKLSPDEKLALMKKMKERILADVAGEGGGGEGGGGGIGIGGEEDEGEYSSVEVEGEGMDGRAKLTVTAVSAEPVHSPVDFEEESDEERRRRKELEEMLSKTIQDDVRKMIDEVHRAIEDFVNAVSLKPTYFGYHRLGALTKSCGQFRDSLQYLTMAINWRSDPETFLERGEIYEKIRQYEYALQDFTSAICLAPNYSKAYFRRAFVYEELDRPEEAIDDYTRALQLNPQYYEALCNRAVVYLSVKRYHDAERDYSDALRIRPDDPDALLLRGEVREKLGYFVKADADFSRVIESCPRDHRGYIHRANLRRRLSNYDGALADFSEALRYTSSPYDVHLSRAEVLKCAQRFDEAVREYTKAIDLDAHRFEAFFDRADAFDELGDYDASIRDYSHVAQLNTRFCNTFFNRALVHEKMGELQLALKDYDEVLRLQPTDYEALYQKATVHLRMQNVPRTIELLTEVLSINPSFLDALTSRASVFMRVGRLDEAIEDLRKCDEVEARLDRTKPIRAARMHCCFHFAQRFVGVIGTHMWKKTRSSDSEDEKL